MDGLLTISNVLLWLFLLFQFFCFIMLAKLVSNFLNRFRLSNRSAEAATMEIGAQAPLFREIDQNGNTVILADTRGKSTLLLFTNDSCPVCKALIPKLPDLQAKLDLRIVVIAPEAKDAPRREIPAGIHFIRSNQVIEEYRRPGAPQMILLDANRYIIGNEIATDARQLEIIVRFHMQLAG